jgi:hypothetical protein
VAAARLKEGNEARKAPFGPCSHIRKLSSGRWARAVVGSQRLVGTRAQANASVTYEGNLLDSQWTLESNRIPDGISRFGGVRR